MFTIDQIASAHAKVKSGADFPTYIKELKTLGVQRYETFVSDGHTQYSGSGGYQISTPPKYQALVVSEQTNRNQFQTDLKAHQQGQTDYPAFCRDCAKSGVVKWVVDLEQMSCTYFDTAGLEVLVEKIPS